MDHRLIAGVDEAGRGPLAGPVSAAAVILDARRPIGGLADSKQLTAKCREVLADEIRVKALAYAVAWASVDEIDSINILQASLLAMQRAIGALATAPELVLVDGNRCPDLHVPARAIIGGDATEAAISAASILAKVARDRLMVDLDKRFPGYGFASHKGYPTRAHLEGLRRLGVCPEHRRTFRPVREILLNHGTM